MSELNLATFERVHAMVRRILKPSFDTENLAMEILLESWEKGHEVHLLVRNRCYDLLRRSQKEKAVMQVPRPRSNDTDQDPASDQRLDVGQLVRVLNTQERKLIFYRYYLDLSLREIARRHGLDVNKVREILASAIFKMRESTNQE